MSAAYDLATFIQTGGFATVGTDMGVNTYLDQMDNEVAVFEFDGRPDLKTHGGITAFEYPRVHVEVRNISSEVGLQKAYDIYTYLGGKMDLTLNGHTYQYIEPLKYPRLLDRKEKNRPVYRCEFLIHRSPE